MNRFTYRSLLAGMLILASQASVAQSGEFFVESNVDRPGMDYRDFDLPEARPELCQRECDSAAECKAYTYVKPGIQGPQARCWLKSDVPNSVANECCISGLKGSLTIELDVDRPGMDLKNFELVEARPELCRTACIDEPECKAYTYVKPGIQGPQARCWLKSDIPNPQPDQCCVSGFMPPAPVAAGTTLECPNASYKLTTGTGGGECIVSGEGIDKTAQCLDVEDKVVPDKPHVRVTHSVKASCKSGCGNSSGSANCEPK